MVCTVLMVEKGEEGMKGKKKERGWLEDSMKKLPRKNKETYRIFQIKAVKAIEKHFCNFRLVSELKNFKSTCMGLVEICTEGKKKDGGERRSRRRERRSKVDHRLFGNGGLRVDVWYFSPASDIVVTVLSLFIGALSASPAMTLAVKMAPTNKRFFKVNAHLFAIMMPQTIKNSK